LKDVILVEIKTQDGWESPKGFEVPVKNKSAENSNKRYIFVVGLAPEVVYAKKPINYQAFIYAEKVNNNVFEINRFLSGLIPRRSATEVRFQKIRGLRRFGRKMFGRMPRLLCLGVVRK
jgi:hypothetical protein